MGLTIVLSAAAVSAVVALDVFDDLAPLDDEADEHEGHDGGANEEGDADDGRTVRGRVAEAAPGLHCYTSPSSSC